MTIIENRYAPTTCPAWCGAHEASAYPDVTKQEQCHVGRHRFALPEGQIDLVITWYLSAYDADGITVKPIEDEPFVNVDVSNGPYSSNLQGTAETLAIVAAAVSATLNGLTPVVTG